MKLVFISINIKESFLSHGIKFSSPAHTINTLETAIPWEGQRNWGLLKALFCESHRKGSLVDQTEIRVDPSLVTQMVKNPPAIQELLFNHSVVSNSLQPHGLQHFQASCPSPSPGACSNSCPLCSAGDLSSVPVSGRSPGEGNGNSLQYSCLGNPMDRGAWQATVYGIAKNWTRLSD